MDSNISFAKIGKAEFLKLLIVHIARDNLVVVGHSLDHEFLDQLADSKLELVERIGPCRSDNFFILHSLFLDLLEEESIFLGEVGPESVIQHLDDLG